MTPGDRVALVQSQVTAAKLEPVNTNMAGLKALAQKGSFYVLGIDGSYDRNGSC